MNDRTRKRRQFKTAVALLALMIVPSQIAGCGGSGWVTGFATTLALVAAYGCTVGGPLAYAGPQGVLCLGAAGWGVIAAWNASEGGQCADWGEPEDTYHF